MLAPQTEKFNDQNYYAALEEALDNAKGLVIFLSPFATVRRLRTIIQPIRRCIARGIRVCAFIQQPWEWATRHTHPTEETLRLEDAIALLRGLGVHVNVRPRPHEKIVIFDDCLVDDGTLNVFSHRDTREKMTRYRSREKVQEALIDQELDDCDECFALCGFHPLKMGDDQLSRRLGSAAADARTKLKLSQRELAERVGLHQDQISDIELAKRNTTISTVNRVYDKLSMNLVPVPSFLVSAVMGFVANATKNEGTINNDDEIA